MSRRVNVFGQPLTLDVGVTYQGTTPVPPQKPVDYGDDVSDATKRTAVKYASDLTNGVEGSKANRNAFPLDDPSSNTIPELRLETPDGNVPPLTIDGNSTVFVSAFSHLGRVLAGGAEERDPQRVEVVAGELASTYVGDTSFIRRGRSSSGEVDGHRLLSDQEGQVDRRVLESYVSPVLKNNRFNEGRKLSSIVGHEKKFNPDHADEGKGSYKKYTKQGTDLSDGHLANIGPMLALRATKELSSISSAGYGKDGPDGLGAKAASLLPGLAQVGAAKVSVDDLTVDSVVKALIEGKTDPTNVEAGSSGPRKVISFDDSYGQINNPLEPFSGLLPLGMVTAGVALSVVLNVALRAILALFLLITNASSTSSQKRDDVGRYIPGDSRFNPAFQKVTFPPIPLPAKLFGLQETVNPFGDAVSEGIKVFFGGNIGGQLDRVLESPGFFVTFCRTVVRSAADLARSLEDVGTGDPISVAENIVGLVSAIRESKVVAVLNVFAQIGDISLSQQARLQRFGADEQRENDSEVDNLEGLAAMRNRKPGSLALAWGATSTPSSFVIPSSAARSMLVSSPGSYTNALADRGNVTTFPDHTRITPEGVEAIERELESEYLPFYFQDLRTNEVLSFQAFLHNLTEEYSPSWDSLDGYGRVDQIRMYKSTQRKIGLAFYVAATNHDDFDGMWRKINKLVTMVYPQWSAGTLLSAGNDRFVQPFSQIPTASPLIRLRVGDLWTSNYSRMSLARLFGLGDDQTFSVDGSSHPDDANVAKVSSEVARAMAKIANNDGKLPADSVWRLEPGDYEAASSDGGALGAAASAVAGIASSVGVKVASTARVVARLRVPTRVVVLKAISANAYTVRIVREDAEGLPESVSEAPLLVSRSHLSACEETLSASASNPMFVSEGGSVQPDDVQADALSAFSKFFSPEQNAVVRSYESTKGRGVACTIDSLSLDWNNVPWETADLGSKAPKMCQITISATVVHDIAPGLDADGFNRAPLYNVGRLSNAMAGRRVTPSRAPLFLDSAQKIRKSLV